MKYKYSRKERIAKYMGDSHYELTQLLKDLLAQKEDKKEWKPCDCPKGGIDGDGMVCDKCGGTEWIKIKTTPSPLDEIEEIEKMVLEVYSDNPVLYELHKKQCEIIDRLNRLVEVIKTLMEK